MFCAWVNASSGVAAYFTPPALPRPPALTWALTITGLPISSAIALALLGGVGHPAGRGRNVVLGEQLLRLVLEKIHELTVCLRVGLTSMTV